MNSKLFSRTAVPKDPEDDDEDDVEDRSGAPNQGVKAPAGPKTITPPVTSSGSFGSGKTAPANPHPQPGRETGGQTR